MKIAVVGSTGQIGRRLVALNAIPMNCNLLDADEIKKAYDAIKPDVIINAAGISSVSACEEDYDKAVSVNVWGHNKLCEVAGDRNVILLSSEHVFDGVKGMYREDDDPCPINDYGMTKFAAEGVTNLYNGKVIRLSRTFNNRIGSDINKFVHDISRGKSAYVPTFFIKNYIHTDFACHGAMHFAERFSDMPDVIHYGGLQPITFYALVCDISDKIFGGHDFVIPREYEIPEAKRPMNCSFDMTLAYTFGMSHYSIEESVNQFTKEEAYA